MSTEQLDRLAPVVTWHPLVDGQAPIWASGWGQDAYGPFVEFMVGSVTQRLRWIPPGRGLIGSPAVEPGRFADELLPTVVAIERGFWLFDTPCTQELWQSVMGENPSRFKSPKRPVERVGWNDCQAFCERMRDHFPSLTFSLPTEEEWEYACRAGTTTATYAGPVEYLGDGNAPALDSIAWYGGNCGVEFDLPDGKELPWLRNKQYEFRTGGTRSVGLRRPNPWGLYDMLGNVWEWCDNEYVAAGASGSTQSPASVERVIRGGSWYNNARFIRAACRLWYVPGERSNGRGLRCRVQERELKREKASVPNGANMELRRGEISPESNT